MVNNDGSCTQRIQEMGDGCHREILVGRLESILAGRWGGPSKGGGFTPEGLAPLAPPEPHLGAAGR